MESLTAELVVQRTAFAGSSSSSHSEARNAFFGFSPFLRSSGCRDNVENQWARRAELRTGRSLPFTRSVRGTAVCSSRLPLGAGGYTSQQLQGLGLETHVLHSLAHSIRAGRVNPWSRTIQARPDKRDELSTRLPEPVSIDLDGISLGTTTQQFSGTADTDQDGAQLHVK